MAEFDWENGESQIEIADDDRALIENLNEEYGKHHRKIEEAIAHAHRVTEVNRIAKDELRIKIIQVISKVTGVDHDDLHHGGWDCNWSPTNRCWYDIHDDPLRDHCLFCALPAERK